MSRIRKALRGVHWYLRELTGESGYDHYLERHAREHPQVDPLTRREFEWRRTDRAQSHPGPRCC